MPLLVRRHAAPALVVVSGCASVVWLTLGPGTTPTGRFALLGLALAGHAVASILVFRRGTSSVVVLTVAALVMVVAVTLPPQGSKDLWAYAMQGRVVAVHHANPYVHRPSEFSDDPALARVAHGWRASRSPYGPVFVAVEATGALLTGGSALGARLLYQGLAAAAVMVVALALRRRPDGTAAAVVLVLNPAAIAAVNGGHNDVLVGAGIMAAVAFADRRRIYLAGAALAVAALVKITALVAGLAIAAWLLRRGRRRCAVLFSSVVVGFLVAGYGLVGGVGALDPVRSASSRGSRAALLEWPRHLLINSLVAQGHSAQAALARSGSIGMAIAIGSVVAVVAFLLVRGAVPGSSQAVVVASMTVLVLMSSYVLPWYALWVLPVAARAPRSRATVAAWILGSALLIAYNEPPGTAPASELTRVLSHIALPIGLLAIVVLAAVGRRFTGAAVTTPLEPDVREPADT